MDYISRLRALREDRDLKQKEIGAILNKSQQGYAHLENGVSRFSIEDIIALCKYYNVSADYILGFTDEQKPLPKD
ncbi:MAG: helix-turn-helix transcriptional regulator [Ruminococcaceae bacterium]|nr:helix-turn-helix transcriptional regulator [Oscillospiraceae bacterium]